MERGESAIKNVVCDLATLDDAFRLIEGPVNAEVNAALAVFVFRLRKRRETARHIRPHDSVISPRNSVELIRDERETNPVRAVESSQSLEERSAEGCVT